MSEMLELSVRGHNALCNAFGFDRSLPILRMTVRGRAPTPTRLVIHLQVLANCGRQTVSEVLQAVYGSTEGLQLFKKSSPYQTAASRKVCDETQAQLETARIAQDDDGVCLVHLRTLQNMQRIIWSYEQFLRGSR